MIFLQDEEVKIIYNYSGIRLIKKIGIDYYHTVANHNFVHMYVVSQTIMYKLILSYIM